jgi:hypothetical protein
MLEDESANAILIARGEDKDEIETLLEAVVILSASAVFVNNTDEVELENAILLELEDTSADMCIEERILRISTLEGSLVSDKNTSDCALANLIEFI